jgi:thymidylate synthase
MNNLDKKYTDLLQDILENGTKKETRNGGTISVFGRQIRHKMSEGFPVLTTKKMAWKTMVTELIWFLRGDTNIKFLVDNNCHIWDGDAYKRFYNETQKGLDSMFLKNEGPNKIVPFTQEEFVNKIKTDDEFAKKWGDLGPVYGKQWRNWGGYKRVPSGWNHGSVTHYKDVPNNDQIANLINDLKTNPDSRRLMVNAWNVGELDSMVLPPCHYGFQVYTRELKPRQRTEVAQRMGITLSEGSKSSKEWDKECDERNVPKRAISLMWNQRSCDFPLGIPMNISSYALLLTIIAKEVNMVPDELIGNLGDCHIYLNQIEGVKEQISREPYPLPKLLCLDEYHYLMDKELVGEIPFTEKIEKFRPDFFTLENYQSHPSIKMPLSN